MVQLYSCSDLVPLGLARRYVPRKRESLSIQEFEHLAIFFPFVEFVGELGPGVRRGIRELGSSGLLLSAPFRARATEGAACPRRELVHASLDARPGVDWRWAGQCYQRC